MPHCLADASCQTLAIHSRDKSWGNPYICVHVGKYMCLYNECMFVQCTKPQALSLKVGFSSSFWMLLPGARSCPMQLEHSSELEVHGENRPKSHQEERGGMYGTATVSHCPLVTGCLIRLVLTPHIVPGVALTGFLDVQAEVAWRYGVITSH